MLRKVEWGVALLATILAIYLHFVFFRHAGGLWRDEVGTINLAARSSLSDIWSHLFYDSFPAFWVLVTRAWLLLGFGNDNGLRLLGFLVGLSVLGALWFNARRLKISFPFFSLLLLGFSPTIIIWGDSMRAWGWGVLWIVITFGCIWKVIESPTHLNVAAAALAAIASVHTTYYNSVLLFALCAAGALVSLRNGLWKRSALVLGIGMVAAITVIPYFIGIHRIGNNYLIMQSDYGPAKFISSVVYSVSAGGKVSGYVWGLLLLTALVVGIFCQFRPAALNATPGQKDLLLFSLATLAIGVVAYFLFLKQLKYDTQAWYYAALMAVAALSIDAVLSVMGNSEKGRAFRVLIAVVAFGLVAPTAWNSTRQRMTNMDLIARDLGASVDKKDFIVVNPWYCGLSFQHYYNGAAPWTTLPDIQEHSYHCFSTVMQLMTKEDQMENVSPVLKKISETLKSGNRVWLVGGFTFPPPNQKPAMLPAAPNSPAGWQSGAYQHLWSEQAGYFVQMHITNHKDFVLGPEEGTMNPGEYMPLTMVQGWRD